MPRWDVTASQVEADTFWDAKGDLAVGSAADASVKLAVGCTGGHVLQICSCEASGLKWASAPSPTGNIDNGTSNITSGGIWSVDIDSGATINTSGGGIGAAGSLTLGVGADAGLYVSGDDLYVENKTSDNDLVFRINDGGTFTEVARVVGSVSAMRFAEISTPAQPAGGAGGYLYAKADGKPYWRSNEVGETDLSGGGGITINANTNNNLITATGTDNCVQGEARLTYSGTSMRIQLAAGSPDCEGAGTVQIWEASAGSVTPTANAHHLIIEHSCNAGISILTPANKIGRISFGSPTDNNQGNVLYNHCGDTMTLRTANTDRVDITAGSVDLKNNTLCNVGIAGNDWTANTLSMANTNAGGTTPQIQIQSTNGGDEGPEIRLIHESTSPADNDHPAMFRVLAEDSGGTKQDIFLFYVRFEDVTQSSLDSSLVFRVACNVNNGEGNVNATLTRGGVWTDASGEITKSYEGSAIDVWGGRPCHVVLDKIMDLNVGRYHSSRQLACKPITERHISPTAEQMYDLFGVGYDPREVILNDKGKNTNTPGLSPKDLGGVALMGIQELTKNTGAVLNSHERRLEELEAKLGGCSG